MCHLNVKGKREINLVISPFFPIHPFILLRCSILLSERVNLLFHERNEMCVFNTDAWMLTWNRIYYLKAYQLLQSSYQFRVTEYLCFITDQQPIQHWTSRHSRSIWDKVYIKRLSHIYWKRICEIEKDKRMTKGIIKKKEL